MKLLVVEDEKDVAIALCRGLTQNGYAIGIAENGNKALDLLETNNYDLMVLDLNLPDVDGLDICRLAHSKQPLLLILILTARGKQKDIITGLDNGADDYLIKPFHLQELLARIRALLRRDTRTREPILKIRDISLDSVEKVVWKADHRIRLTRKEFGILEYLMRHPNEVISQEELLEHVWGSLTNIFSNTIRVHIQSLREKLGDNSENSKYIATIIGAGYSFIRSDDVLIENEEK
ncbi:MAG TPA: response regulator transcription factor [Bellilinea sp.]|nr:response regulator transcription factor [Bellilinea sp.]